jgi:hypothetical protein
MLHECWGSAGLDEFAEFNIEEAASFFTSLGFAPEEARAMARKSWGSARGRPKSEAAKQVRDYFSEVDALAHRNPDGTVSGWGRFWTHCLYLRWTGRNFLSNRRLPHEPGAYTLQGDQWKKTAERAWRIELDNIDGTSTEATAASLASLADLSLQKMRQEPYDTGDALDLAYHLGELHMEFLLRRFELIKLARTGHKVAQQGIRPDVRNRGDEIFQAFVEQPSPRQSARFFAEQNFEKFGFRTASAAQRAISRRQQAPLAKRKSRSNG